MKKNTQKVIHLMSSYGGGISSFIRNKAEVLKNDTITFDVITFNNVPSEFRDLIESTGGEIHQVVNPKQKGFKLFYNQVNDIFKEQPKDILIHSHVDGFIALPFYLIAKKNGLHRFVIHAHTAAPSNKSSMWQENMKKNINQKISKEKLSCGIKASANIFGEKSAESQTIMHIPNSINFESFTKEKNSKELKKEILDIEDDRLIIGSIARFRELKNHYFMLDVIEKLKLNGTKFLWFFAGDGLLKEEIEASASKRGLNDCVKFLGRRDDIPDLFEIMDIFALPSFFEGLPTVVIEAQAASKTSFVSNTITQECDLGLGLVEFLSIQDADIWAKEISSFSPKLVELEVIEKTFLENKFTNETSAELYKDFVNKQIHSYKI